MKIKGSLLKEVIDLVPGRAGSFKSSQFPLPVYFAISGKEKVNLAELKSELDRKSKGDIKDFIEPLLIAAELYESSLKDRPDYFITDSTLRKYVFTGSKWKAGWVLVLGATNETIIQKFLERDFMVLTDYQDTDHDGLDSRYIGSRDTSPIYFLQMMFRYAMIWGRINPGQSHEMSHFLEKDMPGLIVVAGDLSPLKYHIVLGLMKMGAPAVVPSSFPFPYGNRIVADRIDEILEKAVSFPNLRVQHYKEEVISLPSYANAAYSGEKIKAVKTWGATNNSFFLLKKEKGIKKAIDISGKPINDIGIIVEIDHKDLSFDMELTLEKEALSAINYIPGIKAVENKGMLVIKADSKVLEDKKIAETIFWGLRLTYPRLENIKVKIEFDSSKLAGQAESIREYKAERKEKINEMTEDNTDTFCACIECRPFSLEHTCILTPDRIPMCAARTYFTVKAASLFGNTIKPYRRESEKVLPLKSTFSKGRMIDELRGEYEGSNQVYRKLTKGKLDRVYLHSLRGTPHTSCGCFQNLAFWMDKVEGIGIMSRDSEAIAPGGITWDILANRAGGKQSDGIMGVSLAYIKSKNFLKGDGGIGNVVWVDSKLYEKIKNKFVPGQKTATEKDVK
ncbi:MAG: hypothetical protein V3R31_06620 [Candidatus Humimicrobiaceae bacterium]